MLSTRKVVTNPISLTEGGLLEPLKTISLLKGFYTGLRWDNKCMAVKTLVIPVWLLPQTANKKYCASNKWEFYLIIANPTSKRCQTWNSTLNRPQRCQDARNIAIIQIRGRVGSKLHRKAKGCHNYIMIFTWIMKRDIIPNLQQTTNIHTAEIKMRQLMWGDNSGELGTFRPFSSLKLQAIC